MRENAGLMKEKLDIRWVSMGIRVSVKSALPDSLPVLSQIASITIRAKWVRNRERFNSFCPRVDVVLLQTLLDRGSFAR